MNNSLRRRPVLALALATVLLISIPAVNAETAYMTEGPGPTELYEVDVDALEATFLKVLTSGNAIHALAQDPGAPRLVGVAKETGGVFEVDLTDPLFGETVLGTLPVNFLNRVVQLAFAADGTLWLTNTVEDTLYTLDLTTCAVACTPVLVGTVTDASGRVDIEGADIAFSGAGELFLLSNDTDSIYSVDPTDATATLLGVAASLPGNVPGAIVTQAGDLFFVTNGVPGQAYSASTSDGSITPLGTLTDTFDSSELNILNGDLANDPFPTAGLLVPVDIKPTSCPNPVDLRRSGGVLPVAILGTADFDVTTVDPSTVELVGVEPLRWGLQDVATPHDPFVGQADCRDCSTAGPDGFLDMTFKFPHGEVMAMLELAGAEHGDCFAATLTGQLNDGTPFEGEDVLRVSDRNQRGRGR